MAFCTTLAIFFTLTLTLNLTSFTLATGSGCERRSGADQDLEDSSLELEFWVHKIAGGVKACPGQAAVHNSVSTPSPSHHGTRLRSTVEVTTVEEIEMWLTLGKALMVGVGCGSKNRNNPHSGGGGNVGSQCPSNHHSCIQLVEQAVNPPTPNKRYARNADLLPSHQDPVSSSGHAEDSVPFLEIRKLEDNGLPKYETYRAMISATDTSRNARRFVRYNDEPHGLGNHRRHRFSSFSTWGDMPEHHKHLLQRAIDTNHQDSDTMENSHRFPVQTMVNNNINPHLAARIQHSNLQNVHVPGRLLPPHPQYQWWVLQDQMRGREEKVRGSQEGHGEGRDVYGPQWYSDNWNPPDGGQRGDWGKETQGREHGYSEESHGDRDNRDPRERERSGSQISDSEGQHNGWDFKGEEDDGRKEKKEYRNREIKSKGGKRGTLRTLASEGRVREDDRRRPGEKGNFGQKRNVDPVLQLRRGAPYNGGRGNALERSAQSNEDIYHPERDRDGNRNHQERDHIGDVDHPKIDRNGDRDHSESDRDGDIELSERDRDGDRDHQDRDRTGYQVNSHNGGGSDSGHTHLHQHHDHTHLDGILSTTPTLPSSSGPPLNLSKSSSPSYLLEASASSKLFTASREQPSESFGVGPPPGILDAFPSPSSPHYDDANGREENNHHVDGGNPENSHFSGTGFATRGPFDVYTGRNEGEERDHNKGHQHHNRTKAQASNKVYIKYNNKSNLQTLVNTTQGTTPAPNFTHSSTRMIATTNPPAPTGFQHHGLIQQNHNSCRPTDRSCLLWEMLRNHYQFGLQPVLDVHTTPSLLAIGGWQYRNPSGHNNSHSSHELQQHLPNHGGEHAHALFNHTQTATRMLFALINQHCGPGGISGVEYSTPAQWIQAFCQADRGPSTFTITRYLDILEYKLSSALDKWDPDQFLSRVGGVFFAGAGGGDVFDDDDVADSSVLNDPFVQRLQCFNVHSIVGTLKNAMFLHNRVSASNCQEELSHFLYRLSNNIITRMLQGQHLSHGTCHGDFVTGLFKQYGVQETDRETMCPPPNQYINVNGLQNMLNQVVAWSSSNCSNHSKNSVHSNLLPNDDSQSSSFRSHIRNQGDTEEEGKTVQKRHQMSAGLLQISKQFYSARQLLDIVLGNHTDRVNMQQFYQLCPALLQQTLHLIEAVAEERQQAPVDSAADITNDDGDEEIIDRMDRVPATRMQTYGLGTAAVTVITLCSLLGAVFVICCKSVGRHYAMATMVALAVGNLCGDAILHLLPEALGFGHHGPAPFAVSFRHHQHKHDTSTDVNREYELAGGLVIDDVRVKCLALLASVYLFWFLEIITSSFHDKRRASYKVNRPKKETNNSDGGTSIHMSTLSEMTEISPGQARDGSYEMVITAAAASKPVATAEKEFAESSPHLAWLVVVGDAVHNFADGLAIGAAFAHSVTLGLSTSMVVVVHEIPHEIGDFVVLISTGMKVSKALLLNLLSALTAFVGLYIGISLGASVEARQWMFIVVAGMFLYIALANLIPELVRYYRHYRSGCMFLVQSLGMLSGFALMLLLVITEDKLHF